MERKGSSLVGFARTVLLQRWCMVFEIQNIHLPRMAPRSTPGPALAVYDVTRRDTFSSLEAVWMQEFDIYSTVENAIKMVVANKVDLVRQGAWAGPAGRPAKWAAALEPTPTSAPSGTYTYCAKHSHRPRVWARTPVA